MSHISYQSAGGSLTTTEGHLLLESESPPPALREALSMSMAPGDACQTNCDDCPVLCSAFLPSSSVSIVFPPLDFTLTDTATERKVSASSTVFRPPIAL